MMDVETLPENVRQPMPVRAMEELKMLSQSRRIKGRVERRFEGRVEGKEIGIVKGECIGTNRKCQAILQSRRGRVCVLSRWTN